MRQSLLQIFVICLLCTVTLFAEDNTLTSAKSEESGHTISKARTESGLYADYHVGIGAGYLTFGDSQGYTIHPEFKAQFRYSSGGSPSTIGFEAGVGVLHSERINNYVSYLKQKVYTTNILESLTGRLGIHFFLASQWALGIAVVPEVFLYYRSRTHTPNQAETFQANLADFIRYDNPGRSGNFEISITYRNSGDTGFFSRTSYRIFFVHYQLFSIFRDIQVPRYISYGIGMDYRL